MQRQIEMSTVLIAPGLTRSKAIVAAMMGAAHVAAAKIAVGAIWENDHEIVIAPCERRHALRMARIWRQAAIHLDRCEEQPNRSASAPRRAGPAKTASR